ncbi:MAG: enoyl-CoA hydratase/isomerase family protein [Candidatus Poseidoniaceae archaeon]
MTVEVSKIADGVSLVKLSGDSASASFSRKSMPVIAKAIRNCIDDKEIKAIVITGDGKFFSAGADIQAFAESIKNDESVDLIRYLTGLLHPLLVKMRESPTICIAAINGAAAGGGLGLALACDYRIASPQAKIAASYSGMGLSPDGGTTWLLPRLVGLQKAREFFLENQIWSAEQCRAYGAIDSIAQADLIEEAKTVAVKWSSWQSHTKEATKHLLDVAFENDFKKHLDHERTLIEASGLTDGFKEGVEAFLEKRKPNFDSLR